MQKQNQNRNVEAKNRESNRTVVIIGHFTVVNGTEAEGDLVLIQTFFALLWKLFLKNGI